MRTLNRRQEVTYDIQSRAYLLALLLSNEEQIGQKWFFNILMLEADKIAETFGVSVGYAFRRVRKAVRDSHREQSKW